MLNGILKSKKEHWLARRLPFFYGWIIIPISMITILATSPGQTYMISVFNPSFRESLGISASQLSGAYMFGTLLASLPQAMFGRWMDRFGIRPLLIWVTVAFGLACAFMSTVQNLFMLFIAFFLLRMLGQGVMNLMGSNMMAMWWREKLGTLSGIRGIGISVLIGFVPALVLFLMNQQGWRNTYIISGIAVVAVMLPIAIFFMISRPEDIGKYLDDRSKSDAKADLFKEAENTVSLTVQQTMRTRSFWILLSINVAMAAVITGVTFHLLPIFSERGLSAEQATNTFAILSIVGGGMSIVGGALADRMKLNWLAFLAMASYGLSMVALLVVPNGSLIWVYAILIGTGQGLLSGVFSTVWVRYFGREHLGKIRGVTWTASAAGSSVGPFLMGLGFDSFGNYQIAIFVCAAIFLILAVASFWADKPQAPVIGAV